MSKAVIAETVAQQIFRAAIVEERCSEMLSCLFGGGSCTVDAQTGKLVLVDGDMLRRMMGAE